MSEAKTNAEKKASADQIKDVEATQVGPRGNVHSEKSEDDPTPSDVPPMPN